MSLHNLPGQLTSFIGRERAVVELGRLLGTTRLLTLTGVGGVGKTRLALQVAADVLDGYSDGVWLVELASLSDPALVPQAVASVLHVHEQPGRPLPATLAEALRPRKMLLVLDNCEHLVGACAALADGLLRTCAGLRALATSREALGVAGEMPWRVPSLSVPDPEQRPTTEHLMACEGVRLFVERARVVRPAFAVTDRNAMAVAEVCRQLDGIPLAIELAAARITVLTVEQIAARLGDRFRLLTGGNRMALSRHQTLRALVDWSYELLSGPERILLRRLSTFAGGWSLEATEAVCAFDTGVSGPEAGAGIAPDEVLDLLSQLTDKSLVLAEEHGREARYRLLETIRQYGAERLQEAGEDAAARARHLAWFLTLAETAEPKLHSREADQWLARLEAEYDNLRSALAWSLTTHGDAESGVRLAGALWWFWLGTRSYLGEGRRWLEQALAAHGRVPPSVRAKALNAVGQLTYYQADYGQAVAFLEAALSLSQEVGDDPNVAHALTSLGFVAQYRGDYSKAMTLLDEALAVARQAGDRFAIFRALNIQGVVAYAVGDLGQARALHEETLSVLRQGGNPRGFALAFHYLGRVAYALGDYDRAATLLEESRALMGARGTKLEVARTISILGQVARIRGDHEQAVALQQESLALQRDVGDRWGMAASLERLAGIFGVRGQPERAAVLFGASQGLREAIETPIMSPERAEYDRDIKATRAQLGDEAFAAAWAAGRAMPLEGAIEQALPRADLAPLERSAFAAMAAEDAPSPLTPREREVAALVARGLTNRQVADALVIAERTASTHVAHILNKLDFTTRALVAAWAVEQGLTRSRPG